MTLLRAFVACLAVVWTTSAARAGPITEIVAFGDSLTDTGNVYNLAGNTFPASPPYFNGRFSNGPVWIERLAADLGLPTPTPSRLGGTNNAYGGAETALTGLSTQNTPNIGTQVTAYLAAHPTLNSGQLVVVWGGANDFLHFPTLPLPSPAQVVSNLEAEITQLARAGAKNFLVPNLPPLGITPYVSQQLAPNFPGIVGTMNALTADFNSQLAVGLAGLQTSLGIHIVQIDVSGALRNIFANPGLFGFTNLTDQAKSGATGVPGGVVPNPDQYLFWDQVHPTRVLHQLIGDQAAAQVRAELLATPEPATLAVFGALAGVGGFVARRRRVAAA